MPLTSPPWGGYQLGMKHAAAFLCAIVFGSLPAISATAPTQASFAGNYKPTVSTIHLADDNDAFVGGYYANFKIKIAGNGRVRGQALFYTNDGSSVTPVKIVGKLSKFRVSNGEATAEIWGQGNDGLLFFGEASRMTFSSKRNIFFTFVKGDYHSFALFLSRK